MLLYVRSKERGRERIGRGRERREGREREGGERERRREGEVT